MADRRQKPPNLGSADYLGDTSSQEELLQRRGIWPLPDHLQHTTIPNPIIVAIGKECLITIHSGDEARPYRLRPLAAEVMNFINAALPPDRIKTTNYYEIHEMWRKDPTLIPVEPSEFVRGLNTLDAVMAHATEGEEGVFYQRFNRGSGNQASYRLNPRLVFKDTRSWPEVLELLEPPQKTKSQQNQP